MHPQGAHVWKLSILTCVRLTCQSSPRRYSEHDACMIKAQCLTKSRTVLAGLAVINLPRRNPKIKLILGWDVIQWNPRRDAAGNSRQAQKSKHHLHRHEDPTRASSLISMQQGLAKVRVAMHGVWEPIAQ